MQNAKRKPLDQKSLSAASFAALKWDYAGTATRAASSLIITVVLARLLGPEPFGLLAAGWLVIGLANLVADLGLASALLQRKIISDDDVRYAFTMQTCVGLALMGVTALAAPVVGNVFNEVKVVPVVRAMSLVFLFQTVGGIAASLLRRQMDFKGIQFARITSYLAGFLGLGIPLAVLGFGVWSLVIAQISQTTLFSILCYLQVRHPIKPLFSLPSSALGQFGFKVLSTNLVNYLISSIDTFFIGRFFDVITLGLYNRIYVLVSTPMNSVVASVQQVTFSAYSRKQGDTCTVRCGYLAGFGFMTMLMLPPFGCMALVPETIIQGLFGSQWEAAVPFLVPLALAMPFHAVMATGGPMLWAEDQVGREFVAQVITAFALFLVLLATSTISAIAIAWGVLGVTIFRFLLITHASLKTVQASWRSLLTPIYGGMLLLILTGSTVLLSDWALQAAELPATPRLAINMLLGTIIFVATTLLIPRQIFSAEMYWLAERLNGLLPTWTHPFTRRISDSATVPV